MLSTIALLKGYVLVLHKPIQERNWKFLYRSTGVQNVGRYHVFSTATRAATTAIRVWGYLLLQYFLIRFVKI